MATIRTFVAFETPELERNRLSEIQSVLKQHPSGVKWESEDKFHTTVKFLGDTNETFLPEIMASIALSLHTCSTFSLKYDSLGFFPNWHDPKVAWIGCGESVPMLSQIKSKLDRGLLPFGFAIENRTFHPHITLGRIKDERGVKHLLSIAESLTFESLTIHVSEFMLMKSILRPEGSKYFVVEKFTLGQQGLHYS